jgi:hypothetical protein
MKIRPLIIGPDERARIAEVRAFAAGNVIDPKGATEAANRDRAAFRDTMEMHSIVLPHGYAVTYSLEHQQFGLASHVSVSVSESGKMPSPAAVEMILTAFGMAPLDQSVGVWVEDDESLSGHAAVNVLQRVPS